MAKEKSAKNNGLQDTPLLGLSTEKMFQPTILIFICQKPTYGYELIQELSEHGFAEGEIEPATVYQHLRRMEESGFVRSRWDNGGPGPARRLYEITPDGLEHLRAWGDLLKRRREKLDDFLNHFDRVMSNATTK